MPDGMTWDSMGPHGRQRTTPRASPESGSSRPCSGLRDRCHAAIKQAAARAALLTGRREDDACQRHGRGGRCAGSDRARMRPATRAFQRRRDPSTAGRAMTGRRGVVPGRSGARSHAVASVTARDAGGALTSGAGLVRAGRGASRPVSRVLYGAEGEPAARDDHSSGAPVAGRLERSTRATARKRVGRRAGHAAARPVAPIRSCSRWGLPCRRRCRRRGALLPHPFTLTRTRDRSPAGRSAFCGAVPGVAPAGRYPAPCFRGARTFLRGTFRGCARRPSGRLARPA